MVIPVKLLPYLLVIAGLFGLFTAEIDFMASLVMAAIGGVWLYFKYQCN